MHVGGTASAGRDRTRSRIGDGWVKGPVMLEGQQIGAYLVKRLLGHGGMSHVYLAQDVRLGRDVALKVLDDRLAHQAGFRDRFLREARVAAALDHPHIVPLYDV